MSLSLDNAARLVLRDDYVGFASMGHERAYWATKRAFDVCAGIVGCAVLVPVTVGVKLAYVLTGDFHSIFYTQERIGLGGKVFKLYKFRSMVPNADEELKKLLRRDKAAAKEYKEMKKLMHDPRVTKVGRFIRRASLDELPQMINILKGEMSVVGCRPYLPREQKDMRDAYEEIVTIKPGLTGFWQVSLRSRGTFKERVRMEQYYANNYSLKFDAKILMKTIGEVTGMEGAR